MSDAPLDVVGIGSMVVDRVHRAPRILGRGEKGFLGDVDGAGPVRRFVGGVVLNHLGWAAALGLRTGIFGRQAADEDGRFLREAMDRMGIARDIVLEGSATSIAEIFVDDVGERTIYMAPGATLETRPEHVRGHEAFVARARRLTTEVSQLPLAAAYAALELAHERGVSTVVDLDLPPSAAIASGLGDASTLDAVLRAADLLKPARGAARELVPEAGGDALALARGVRERFSNQTVVVTDGAAGCAIATETFEGFIPSKPVKAIDTTGAGDAFLGGMLVALAYGLEWDDAGRLGNACGAACSERLGAFPSDPDEVRARVLELYDGSPFELEPTPASPPGVRSKDARPSREIGEEASASLDVTVEALAALRERLVPVSFEAAVSLIRTAESAGRRVHVTGVGKAEHVAHYAASVFSSTGTPATFLHATEVVHGSAGQIIEGDVVIAVSNSGETVETRAAVEQVRRMGARVIGVTGNRSSWLADAADVVLDAGVQHEGGPLGLAPRASVAAEVAVLAALSATLERARGFTKADYNLRHPAGDLGRRSRRK